MMARETLDPDTWASASRALDQAQVALDWSVHRLRQADVAVGISIPFAVAGFMLNDVAPVLGGVGFVLLGIFVLRDGTQYRKRCDRLCDYVQSVLP